MVGWLLGSEEVGWGDGIQTNLTMDQKRMVRSVWGTESISFYENDEVVSIPKVQYSVVAALGLADKKLTAS